MLMSVTALPNILTNKQRIYLLPICRQTVSSHLAALLPARVTLLVMIAAGCLAPLAAGCAREVVREVPAEVVVEKVLGFMLSPVAQQYLAGQTFEYPLVEGVRTRRIPVALDDMVKPDLTAGDLADLAGTQAMLQEKGVLP